MLQAETTRQRCYGAGAPIYFNMRFLTQPLSGMQRYAEELLLALDRRVSARCQPLHPPLIGLVPPGNTRRHDWKSIKLRQIGRMKGHAWEQFVLPWCARKGRLVSLSGSGPFSHRRQILAVHDANLAKNPHFYSRSYRALHGFLRPRLIRRAETLLTISDFSASEIASIYEIKKSQLTVIHDSAEHITATAADLSVLKNHGLRKDGYILCVGNLSPNKNIGLAIDAFKALERRDLNLAVVGSSPTALAAAEFPNEPWLSMLGRVSDGELRALYENAAAFVFPSVYEGFGVPPLEALTLGCPVVSSDSSAMPEILGDSANFFKSGDAADCARRIDEVLNLSVNEKVVLSERGRTRASQYSWDKSAETLAKLLNLHGAPAN